MNKLIVVAALLVSQVAWCCGKGESEYRGGCVVDIQPEIAKPVQPSDEKPPSDKMPSYQREGVKVIDAPSMTMQDAKADQDKLAADHEGKQRAGLEPKMQ